MDVHRRAGRALVALLALHTLLVATHEGEFWPFSIYPMFSRGGQTWSRALVQHVPDGTPVTWDAYGPGMLPGEPVALAAEGVDVIDLANFVGKTDVWHARRVDALRRMLRADSLREGALLVLRVEGRLDRGGGDAGAVSLRYEPYALLSPRETALNPALATR